MTAYTYMQKHLRGVADGIAWAQQVFTTSTRLSPADLIDAAVDIAWERLRPKRSERANLDIRQRGTMLVFSLKPIEENYAR